MSKLTEKLGDVTENFYRMHSGACTTCAKDPEALYYHYIARRGFSDDHEETA